MPENTPTTLIANGTYIKGEVQFGGPAAVSGRLEGQIATEHHLEITPEGSVMGKISAATLDIHGTLQAQVCATQICRIGPTAKLVGELRAATLSVAEGATFVGKVFIGSEAPAAEQPRPAAATPVETIEETISPTSYQPLPTDDAEELQPAIHIHSQNLQNALASRSPRVIKSAH